MKSLTISRGRRTFIAGAIGLLVFGGVHLLAVYQSLLVSPSTTAEVEADRALRALKMDMGPFHPTGWHTVNILNSSYSALLLYAGVLNLVSVGPAVAAGRLRILTVVNIVFVAILLTIVLALQFPPPALFAAITLILFLASFLRQGGAKFAGSV